MWHILDQQDKDFAYSHPSPLRNRTLKLWTSQCSTCKSYIIKSDQKSCFYHTFILVIADTLSISEIVLVSSNSCICDISAVTIAAAVSTQYNVHLYRPALVCVWINRHHPDNITEVLNFSYKTCLQIKTIFFYLNRFCLGICASYNAYFTSNRFVVFTGSTTMSFVAFPSGFPFTRISTLIDSESTAIGHWSDWPVVTNMRPEHPFSFGVDFSANYEGNL